MRVRAMVVILLSVVCGVAAAFGVFQVLESRNAKSTIAETAVNTVPVVVAVGQIDRAEWIEKTHLKTVDWPADYVPDGAFEKIADVVGMVATSPIPGGTPVFATSLSDKKTSGYMSSLITDGMRAYSIQASGPSSSVAGFVRPTDYVDILLTISSSPDDQFGGATTMTLLKGVMILAIDQTVDVDPSEIALWAKGGKLTSVTLLVTPEESELLALAEDVKSGKLSLALRKMDDPENLKVRNSNLEPTMRAIMETITARQEMERAILISQAGSPKSDETAEPQQTDPPRDDEEPAEDVPPSVENVVRVSEGRDASIRTSRAGQPGRVVLSPAGN